MSLSLFYGTTSAAPETRGTQRIADADARRRVELDEAIRAERAEGKYLERECTDCGAPFTAPSVAARAARCFSCRIKRGQRQAQARRQAATPPPAAPTDEGAEVRVTWLGGDES